MISGAPEIWHKRINLEDVPVHRPVQLATGIYNDGPLPARGVVVELSAPRGAEFIPKYSNCRYTDSIKATCCFDTTVEPGQAFDLAEPLLLDMSKLTRADIFVFSYAPGQSAGPHTDPASPTKPGSGPELALEPTSPFKHDTRVGRITTSTKVDLQAVAGDLPGKQGETVDLVVGVRNAGPGIISSRYYSYKVTPPKGATLIPPVKPDPDPEGDMEPYWECGPWRAAAEHYTCAAKSLDAGESLGLSLQFRIDDAEAGGGGKVEALLDKEYEARDPDKANNTAEITVNGKGNPPDTGGLAPSLTTGLVIAGIIAFAATVPLIIRRRH